jgi:hypothetical protein
MHPLHHVNIRTEFLTNIKDFAEGRHQQKEQGQTKPQKMHSH